MNDREAEALGHYSNWRMVGLARKKHKDWTSIYTAVPLLPSPVVKNIIEKANVHLYMQGNDIVYANSSYVGIFTRDEECPRTISLPSARKVMECFSGEEIARSPVNKFTFAMKQYKTYLFQLTCQERSMEQ